MVVGGRELIDTLWNVNIFLDTHAFSAIIELIDTLWNVNFIYGISVISINCELIDTLWNVNERHVFMGNTYF